MSNYEFPTREEFEAILIAEAKRERNRFEDHELFTVEEAFEDIAGELYTGLKAMVESQSAPKAFLFYLNLDNLYKRHIAQREAEADEAEAEAWAVIDAQVR